MCATPNAKLALKSKQQFELNSNLNVIFKEFPNYN